MSTDCYYGQFTNLLTKLPVKIDFYEELVRDDFNEKRKFIIFENIKDELLDTLLNTKPDWEILETLWNKTPFNFEFETIKHFFTDIIGKVPKEIYNVSQDVIDKYIEACCNLIVNYDSNKASTNGSEVSSKALIKYLYRNPDDGIIHTDFLDFLIQLFDNLCQSLLKGEYLIHNIPGKPDDRNYYNKIVNEYDNFRNESNRTRTEENPSHNDSSAKDEPELSRYLRETVSFMTGKKNDSELLIEDILSTKLNLNDRTGEKYEHPFKIYLSIDRMLYDYQIFTEKVRAYAETEKHRHYFEEEDRISIDYEKEYISCHETLFAAPIAFGNIMEYIFRLLLEMCLIDHNYIATDRNFKLLMKLHSLLSESSDSCQNTEYKLPNLLDFIKENSLINHKHIEALKETIHLLKVKADALLLKMWIKTYKNEHITYTARYGNTEPQTNAFYLFLDIEKEIRGQFESNVIDDRFNDLMNKKINVKEKEFKFKDYEELFTRLICEPQEDYKTMFSDLERIIEKPAYEISGKEHYNIYCYNNVIYQNFICHFGRYGRYIKRLKIDIKGKRNDEYLEEIEYFLKQNNQKDMLSCAFIIKHINWLLNVLENSFINKSIPDENNFDTGFKYLRLAEVILKHFENLIASIEADTYCMNYSSFFQDCFFEFEKGSSTERKGTLKRSGSQKIIFEPNDKNSRNIIFISSTWQPSVDLINLKRRYDVFLSRIKLLSTDFYHKYYQHFISLQESNLEKIKKESQQELSEKVNEITQETKKQLSDNKKETVQILGIFAAFLAIATIGMEKIGNIASLDTISLIFSICTCFGYFIILLQLITRNSNKTVTTIIIAILTSFLLYGTFFIENERTPLKEKQSEKTETTYPTIDSRIEVEESLTI